MDDDLGGFFWFVIGAISLVSFYCLAEYFDVLNSDILCYDFCKTKVPNGSQIQDTEFMTLTHTSDGRAFETCYCEFLSIERYNVTGLNVE